MLWLMKIYEHGTGLQYFNGFLLDKFYMPKDKLLLAKNTKNKNKQHGPIDIYLWEFTSISFHG